MIGRRILQVLALLSAAAALIGVFAWTTARFMQAAAGPRGQASGLAWALLLLLGLISALAVGLFHLGQRSARRRPPAQPGE